MSNKNFINRYILILINIIIFTYSFTLAQEKIPNVVVSKTVEDAHFDYLKELHAEESKDIGKILGRLGLTSKGLSEYKRKEYNLYLETYFPNAYSDNVQMFLLELNIEEEQWAEAEMNLLKFVYLYPQSSIYKQVINRGYSVLDEEKYFSSTRDKLIKLLGEAPKSGKTYQRHYQLLSEIHALKDKR